MFAYGLEGATNDYVKAINWYRKAAERGNAKSQLELGTIYFIGLGVPKNDEEAVKWFRKSAEQGNALAQINLGGMYSRGEGVPLDAFKAAEWYRKAADQDLAVAQFVLGAIYGAGQGVEKNDARAVEWIRKAAAQGYFLAQLSLGIRYADGQGVPKDLVEGFTWLSLGEQKLTIEQEHADQSEMSAKLSGTKWGIVSQTTTRTYEEAAFRLYERLKTELTPEQMAEAEKRIAAFAEKTKDH
jgi:TPR repeat protein